MKRHAFIKVLAFTAMAPAVLWSACSNSGKEPATADNTASYTCPMHPQIIQHKPGTCPVCGMDLVPFDKNNKDAFLTLSKNQQLLANISVTTIGSTAFSDDKLLSGRLAADPESTVVISSRVAGRIEVLYIRETGVKVTRGQPLYRIYSEQLASLQQEYLLAAAQVKQFPADTRFAQIEKAARRKLQLYDQTDAQINTLLQAQKAAPYVTYTAPVNGVVASLEAGEGQYVAEGGMVMRLEDYRQLWVEADLYPAEAADVRTGQHVRVTVAGATAEPQSMIIQFIAPSLQNGSQLMQVRGTIPNPGNKWQPGTQATLHLPVHTTGDILTLPPDAVIRDGKGTHVWIEKGEDRFEPRRVKTGPESFDAVAITEGLTAGDKVVVTGAYLLYSEYILKKGGDPLAASHH